MKSIYFIISTSILLFCSCRDNNNSFNNNESETLSTNEIKVDKSISPLIFVKTKGKTSDCPICKGVGLYKSPNKDSLFSRCYVSPEYTVLAIEDNEGAGENIYVYKTDSQKDTLFLYVQRDTLYTIKNDFAKWFYGLYDNYLFIDNGTSAQGRFFEVHDIKSRKIIVSQDYFDAKVEFDGTDLSFWVSTELSKDSICPGPHEWDEYGNRTIVVEKIKINLNDLTKEGTNQYDCRMEE